MLEFASKIRICMPHEKARQSAENHDYAALDLVAEGQHETALAESNCTGSSLRSELTVNGNRRADG